MFLVCPGNGGSFLMIMIETLVCEEQWLIVFLGSRFVS